MTAAVTTLPAPSKLSFSIPEVVAATSIKRGRIYAEIKSGSLRTRKCGTRTIVLADDLTAWLTGLRASAPGGQEVRS